MAHGISQVSFNKIHEMKVYDKEDRLGGSMPCGLRNLAGGSLYARESVKLGTAQAVRLEASSVPGGFTELILQG